MAFSCICRCSLRQLGRLRDSFAGAVYEFAAPNSHRLDSFDMSCLVLSSEGPRPFQSPEHRSAIPLVASAGWLLSRPTDGDGFAEDGTCLAVMLHHAAPVSAALPLSLSRCCRCRACASSFFRSFCAPLVCRLCGSPACSGSVRSLALARSC